MNISVTERLEIRDELAKQICSCFPGYHITAYLHADSRYIEILLERFGFTHVLKIPCTCDDPYVYSMQHYPELFI